MRVRNDRPDNPEEHASGASLARVLSVPLAAAVLSAVGLVSALLGDGLWDVLSWFALALPVAAAVRYLLREVCTPTHAARSNSASRSTLFPERER
jgi:hypothetical protein